MTTGGVCNIFLAFLSWKTSYNSKDNSETQSELNLRANRTVGKTVIFNSLEPQLQLLLLEQTRFPHAEQSEEKNKTFYAK